ISFLNASKPLMVLSPNMVHCISWVTLSAMNWVSPFAKASLNFFKNLPFSVMVINYLQLFKYTGDKKMWTCAKTTILRCDCDTFLFKTERSECEKSIYWDGANS